MTDTTASSPKALLNVNAASASEITALDGIGASVAQRIVEYRHEYGPFEQMADLLHVPGVGEKLLSRLRTQIRIEVPVPLSADSLASVEPEAAQLDPAEATVTENTTTQSDPQGTTDARDRQGSKAPRRSDSSPAGAQVRPASVAAPEERSAHSMWESVLLVFTAGILGAAIALIAVIVWPGALGLASQADMSALTLDLEAVRADNARLETDLDQVSSSVSLMETQLSEAASSLASVRDDLADAQGRVSVLRSDMETTVGSLETRTVSSLADLQNQVDRTQDDLAQIDDALADAEAAVASADLRIQEFDAFFTTLYTALEGLDLPAE